MISKSDLYTYAWSTTLSFPLYQSSSTTGVCLATYEVRLVDDIRGLAYQRAYSVTCKMRLRLQGSSAVNVLPSQQGGFSNYPVILQASATLPTVNRSGDSDTQIELLKYAPKTINTTVQTSSGTASGSGTSYMQQQSVGSSTAQTNSYGASASLGFFGLAGVGSIGGDYSTSSTVEHSIENATSAERSSSSNTSSGDSMSIKDWGSYAAVDTPGTSVQWTFGQEYPWNAMHDHFVAPGTQPNAQGQMFVFIPNSVMALLFGNYNVPGATLLAEPPSELALFGVDFAMQAAWLVPFAAAADPFALTHDFSLVRASHLVEPGNTAAVWMDSAPTSTSVTGPVIDLTTLGLDPILSGDPDNGAVTGFLPRHFLPPAASTPSTARILSSANNLQIDATGFDALDSDYAPPMSAALSATQTATLSVKFKLVDADMPLSLYLKHWKGDDNACLLNLTFNGDQTTALNVYVDSKEGEGGDNNLLRLELRNTSYASVDYHDYLVLGLNEIVITVAPAAPATSATYVLRALALGD